MLSMSMWQHVSDCSTHAGAQELQQQLTGVQAELAALSQGGDGVAMTEADVHAGAALAAAAPAAGEVGDRSCQANVVVNTQYAGFWVRLLACKDSGQPPARRPDCVSPIRLHFRFLM